MAQSRNSIKVVSVLGRVSFVRPCWRVRVEMSSAERENTRARDNGGWMDGISQAYQREVPGTPHRFCGQLMYTYGVRSTCPLYSVPYRRDQAHGPSCHYLQAGRKEKSRRAEPHTGELKTLTGLGLILLDQQQPRDT